MPGLSKLRPSLRARRSRDTEQLDTPLSHATSIRRRLARSASAAARVQTMDGWRRAAGQSQTPPVAAAFRLRVMTTKRVLFESSLFL